VHVKITFLQFIHQIAPPNCKKIEYLGGV